MRCPGSSLAEVLGRGGLILKSTKGQRNCVVPIIEPASETLERLTLERLTLVGRPAADQGLRGGTITTATLRDVTNVDEFVRDFGIAGLVRRTVLTGMADSGVPLRVLERGWPPGPGHNGALPVPGNRALTDAGATFGALWAAGGAARTTPAANDAEPA